MKFRKSLKRKNPWKRVPEPNDDYYTDDAMFYIENLADEHPKFLQKRKNAYLNIYTKRAALAASPFVVALVSYSGENELNKGSGTIIASDDDNTGIVFTSANLIRHAGGRNTLADNLKVEVKLSDGKSCDGEICAHDFYLNIVVIRFKSVSQILTPTLRNLDDSLHLNLNQCSASEETSFQLQRHSSLIKLSPGSGLVALGRYFSKPFDVMAAPGVYSLDRCKYDCKELLMSTCRITKCGDGGPLVNRFGEIIGTFAMGYVCGNGGPLVNSFGEVIGITFYDHNSTPFLPINVAYKWWEHYKTYGEFRRPSLGMEAIGFHSAWLNIAEKVIQRFPSISKGVIVEKVISGSSADSAGLRLNDVIIECGGKVVHSFLELFEIIWDNVGHPVELAVARVDHVTPLHLKVMVAEAKPDKLNR